jgi:hypothetical protein
MTHRFRTMPPVWLRVLLVLCLLASLAGYLGPWVAHKAAALVLTGQDMGEFVKFLPDVRAGSVAVCRELFYLPLFAGALGLVLLASSSRLAYPWPVRWLLCLLGIPVALSMLPPAWTPQLMLTAEFRWQAVGIALCLAVILLHWLLLGVRPVILDAIAALLAVVAAIVPVWQFLRIRPMLDEIYGQPVTVGWGLWLMPLALALFCALLLWSRRHRTAKQD